MKKVIYPGTFDPITNGHFDIIKRANDIFDEVVVAVANSDTKHPFFSLQKRLEMVQDAVCGMKKVSVKSFQGLLVDFAQKEDSFIIIRGLRAVSDFEYELQMGYANSSLCSKIETIYLMPHLENAFVSSTIVRSILAFDGDVSHLVPKSILKHLKG